MTFVVSKNEQRGLLLKDTVKKLDDVDRCLEKLEDSCQSIETSYLHSIVTGASVNIQRLKKTLEEWI